MQENDKLATIAHEAHEFMRGFQSLAGTGKHQDRLPRHGQVEIAGRIA